IRDFHVTGVQTCALPILERRGWTNKFWVTKKGNRRGGRPFDKGSLYALLTNPIYVGLIRHKSDLYEGEHEALVTKDLFHEVQTKIGRASCRERAEIAEVG